MDEREGQPMKMMIVLSLALNILVLVPVTYGMATDAPGMQQAYGAASPARGILLALYLAILAASVVLLFKPIVPAVAALLAVQIAYKVMTPFTVGSWENPVVLSNLGIAAFHAVTLGLIVWGSGD